MSRRNKPARTRRWHWYPTRKFPVWLGRSEVLPWVVLPLSVLVGVLAVRLELAAAGGVLGALLLGLLGALALRRLDPERIVAWLTVPSGVQEVQRDGERRKHAWSTIREVTETADALLLATDGGELRFEGHPKLRAALAREVRERLDRQSGEGQILEPSQIAAWLGIGLDESLTLGRPKWQRMLSATAFIALPVALALLGPGRLLDSAVWPALVMACAYLPAAYITARDDTTRVSAYGFDGQGKRIAWDEIDFATRVGPGFVIVADNRSLTLRGRLSKRVMAVVQQVLDAKETGVELPSRMGASEQALSRAESVEVSAERGISPAEGGR